MCVFVCACVCVCVCVCVCMCDKQASENKLLELSLFLYRSGCVAFGWWRPLLPDETGWELDHGTPGWL